MFVIWSIVDDKVPTAADKVPTGVTVDIDVIVWGVLFEFFDRSS